MPSLYLRALTNMPTSLTLFLLWALPSLKSVAALHFRNLAIHFLVCSDYLPRMLLSTVTASTLKVQITSLCVYAIEFATLPRASVTVSMKPRSREFLTEKLECLPEA